VPDSERANWIAEFLGHPESRTFVALLIDREETGRSGLCSSSATRRELSSRTMGASRALYPIRSTWPLTSWPRSCH
jgi:hypothetical protein